MVIIGGSSCPNRSKVDSKEQAIRLEKSIGLNITRGDNAILLHPEHDTDASIVLPVGQQVLSINENDGSTSCLAEFTESEITCLSLSPDHKYIAVCASEEGKEHQLLISQLGSSKASKILRCKSVNPIKSASFSVDAKLIALASTDYVEVWEWGNDRLVLKGGIPENHDINRVQCSHPSFESKLPLITTSGKSHIRSWTVSSKDRISNKSISSEEQDTHFVDHTWIHSREHSSLAAIALSKTGESTVIIFILATGKNSNMPIFNETYKIPIAVAQPDTTLNCICPSEEGFAVAGSHGFIGMFQPDSANSNIFSQVGSVCTKFDDDFRCISSRYEKLLFCSRNKRVYIGSSESLLNNTEADDLKEAFDYHVGSIIAISSAKARPLVMTAGEDKFVRVWDLTTNKVITREQFCDDLKDISLHPNGFQALVCFGHQATMYCIASDSFEKLFDVPGKGCQRGSFSNGGQYFAIAFGRKISVYSSYSPVIKAIYIFNYHTSLVTAIKWSLTDNYLFTATKDEIYSWSLSSGKRNDVVACNVSSKHVDIADFEVCSTNNDGKGYLTILLHTNGSVTTVSSSGNGTALPMTCFPEKACCIQYDESLSMLFLGYDTGTIRVYAHSDEDFFKAYSQFQLNSLHGGAVSCICSPGYGAFISGYGNGNVFVSSSSTLEVSHVFHRKVALVSTEDYQSTLMKIDSLQQDIDDMKLDNDIRGRGLAKEHKDEVDRLLDEKSSLEQEISEMKSRHDMELRSLQNEHANECASLSMEHSNEITLLENKYEDRLLKTTNAVDLLTRQLEDSEKSHTEEFNAITLQHDAELAKIKRDHLDSEGKLKRELACMSDEVDRIELMRQEMLAQQAEEYEKELSQQSLETLNKLQQRQDTIDTINMQIQTLKSKREQQSRMVKDLRSKVLYHQNENGDVNSKCKSAEDEIKRMKLTIAEKDEELGKTNSAIDEMNFQQVVLEKELYMTKTKIDQLVQDRSPLEEALELQKKDNSILRNALQKNELENESLRRQLDIQQQNIKSRNREIRELKSAVRDGKRKLTSLEGNVVHLSGISNDKLLKNEVKAIYQKFVKYKDEMTTEVQKCGEHKEPSPAAPPSFSSNQGTSLKRLQLADNNKTKLELKSVRQSLSRRMSENIILMQDCDDLRRQNSELKSELARLLVNHG